MLIISDCSSAFFGGSKPKCLQPEAETNLPLEDLEGAPIGGPGHSSAPFGGCHVNSSAPVFLESNGSAPMSREKIATKKSLPPSAAARRHPPLLPSAAAIEMSDFWIYHATLRSSFCPTDTQRVIQARFQLVGHTTADGRKHNGSKHSPPIFDP